MRPGTRASIRLTLVVALVATLTHALGAGSPAIDTADAGACPVTDQRGIARPQGAGCDVGAVEQS